MPDPLKQLLMAARAAARYLAPGTVPERVMVLAAGRVRIVELAIPFGVDEAPAEEERPASVAGWSFAGKVAHFDGVPISISPSRVRLLRAIAEAASALTARELLERAFDRETDVANVRYHVKELRRELKAAFPNFEGELIAGTDEGYKLLLK
jgi:DNA-binding response OmpR family regulator